MGYADSGSLTLFEKVAGVAGMGVMALNTCHTTLGKAGVHGLGQPGFAVTLTADIFRFQQEKRRVLGIMGEVAGHAVADGGRSMVPGAAEQRGVAGHTELVLWFDQAVADILLAGVAVFATFFTVGFMD
jgi:hypothetical protein